MRTFRKNPDAIWPSIVKVFSVLMITSFYGLLVVVMLLSVIRAAII